MNYIKKPDQFLDPAPALISVKKSNQLYQELEKVYELQPFIKVIDINRDSKKSSKSNKQAI